MSIALLFPGQGSQTVGMGRTLYEKSASARQLFEEAEAILGLPLRQYMFEGPAEMLKRTSVTQPALYVHGYAVAMERKIEPAAVAGHSLGEFTALAVAGVFDFAEGYGWSRCAPRPCKPPAMKNPALWPPSSACPTKP
jgi:[acyl-carrier-protein] S-malonyltransferase